MVMRSEFALGLTYARLDIPQGEFGFVGRNFCDHCGGFDEKLNYRVLHRQTWEQPEEGVESCPHCGSCDCGPNEQDHGVRVARRCSIMRNPKYREAS